MAQKFRVVSLKSLRERVEKTVESDEVGTELAEIFKAFTAKQMPDKRVPAEYFYDGAGALIDHLLIAFETGGSTGLLRSLLRAKREIAELLKVLAESRADR